MRVAQCTLKIVTTEKGFQKIGKEVIADICCNVWNNRRKLRNGFFRTTA